MDDLQDMVERAIERTGDISTVALLRTLMAALREADTGKQEAEARAQKAEERVKALEAGFELAYRWIDDQLGGEYNTSMRERVEQGSAEYRAIWQAWHPEEDNIDWLEEPTE